MKAACVTTLNEAASIGRLVERLRALGAEVIVADAASADGTQRAALAAGAHVLECPRLPIGPALQRAWAAALLAGADAVVQIDAGGSHNPNDVPRLIRGLENAEVVVGSRFCPSAQYLGGTYRRRAGSRAAAVLCSALSYPHTDWTSGFRAFRAEALRELLRVDYRAGMHGWQIEVLGWAHALGLRVAEVPITYRAGRSSFSREVAGEALAAAWNLRKRRPRFSDPLPAPPPRIARFFQRRLL